MSFQQAIQTALEVAAFVAVLWGIKNEDKLIRWERRFFHRLKKGVKK